MCVLIISTLILKSNILLIILPEASAYSITLLTSLLTQVNSHLLSYPLVTTAQQTLSISHRGAWGIDRSDREQPLSLDQVQTKQPGMLFAM